MNDRAHRIVCSTMTDDRNASRKRRSKLGRSDAQIMKSSLTQVT